MRLAIASRKGAIILALTVLLLMLNFQQLSAQQYGEAKHEYITVRAGELKKYEFYACDGCRVSITFYLLAGPDIMFRILGPGGREVYPKSKVDRLSWSFIAEEAGIYVLEFDNTYSILTGKTVDLALAVSPPLINIPMLTLVAIVSFVAGVILTLIASRLIARRAKA